MVRRGQGRGGGGRGTAPPRRGRAPPQTTHLPAVPRKHAHTAPHLSENVCGAHTHRDRLRRTRRRMRGAAGAERWRGGGGLGQGRGCSPLDGMARWEPAGGRAARATGGCPSPWERVVSTLLRRLRPGGDTGGGRSVPGWWRDVASNPRARMYSGGAARRPRVAAMVAYDGRGSMDAWHPLARGGGKAALPSGLPGSGRTVRVLRPAPRGTTCVKPPLSPPLPCSHRTVAGTPPPTSNTSPR